MAVPRMSACGEGSFDRRSQAVSTTTAAVETTNLKSRTAPNYITTQRATTRFAFRKLTMADGDAGDEHFGSATGSAIEQSCEGACDILLRLFGHRLAGDVTAHRGHDRF